MWASGLSGGFYGFFVVAPGEVSPLGGFLFVDLLEFAVELELVDVVFGDASVVDVGVFVLGKSETKSFN